MNHQLCVLLYSKYSQTCKNLVTSIPKFVKDKIGLQLVCVDNEDIRKRITKSSSVKINSVPTILLLYSNGGVEKYEGNTSFLWLNQIINQLAPPQPPQPPQPRPDDYSDLEVKTTRRRNVRRRNVRSNERRSNERRSNERRSNERRSNERSTEETNSTNIEELDTEEDDSEDDGEDDGRPKPPPVGVRKGAGEYEISKDFGEALERNSDVRTDRGSNLMARAQAMQKERESVKK